MSIELENVLELLSESISIADNNKEFVLDYDSYSEMDYLDLMSKSELEELKAEILDIDIDSFDKKILDLKPKNKKKLTIGASENKPTKSLKKSKPKEVKLLNKEELKTEIKDIDSDTLTILNESLKIKETVKKTRPIYRKNIWTKIKEKITIPDIITLENERCECLISGNPTTGNPSCEYYDFDDTLYCHKCRGNPMDVIQVYAIKNNLDKSEAIKQLVKRYKIEYGDYDKNYIKTEEEIYELFEDFTEKCHKNLLDSKYYDLIKNKRDFTDKTMKLFKIGLFDDNIRKYMDTTYSNKLLQNAGFKSHAKKDKEKKGKLFWKFGKRFVYPYPNRNNQPRYFIYRLIDSEPDFAPKQKYMKQKKTRFVSEKPFGLNSLKKQKDLLIITEGMTDAISVIETGFQCLSPITVRIKKKDIEKMISYCKKYDKVLVVNDNEEYKKDEDGNPAKNDGLEGSIDTLKVLIKHGINCSIGIIPNPKKLEKIDLNDYLRPKKDALNKLDIIIKNSVKGIDFLINGLDVDSTTDDLREIIILIPPNDIILKNNIKNLLTKKIGLPKSDFNKIFKDVNTTTIETQEFEGDIVNIYHEIEHDLREILDIISFKREILIKIDNAYTNNLSILLEHLNVLVKRYTLGYKTLKGDILENLKDSVIIDMDFFCYDSWLLNFKNGYYNFINNEFIKIKDCTKEFIFAINRDYEISETNCPIFKNALEVWLKGNKQINKNDIFEFMCYSLMFGNFLKAFFLNIGNTNTGKTQIMEILKAFVPTNNRLQVSLQRLTSDQFGSWGLNNIILCYYDDLSEKQLYDISMIKSITGGASEISIEAKHGIKEDSKNTAKIWQNGNYLPKIFNSEDSAYLDRAIIIKFFNEIDRYSEDHKEQFHLTITKNKSEMKGIISELIKAGKRLYKRGNFRESIKEYSKEFYIYDSNEIFAFLRDWTVKNSNSSVDFKIAKDLVNEYRIKRKKKMYSSYDIKKEFEHEGVFKTDATIENKKVYILKGIRWKNTQKVQSALDKFDEEN